MKYRYRVLAVLGAFAIITFLDRVCISVAGQAMQRDLGLSSKQWGWILGAFVLSYCCFEVPAGQLGDRIGPRRVLTRIVLWWSGFTALTGAVSGFWPLAGVRFLFGAGEAGAYPNGSAVIYRWFPATERARAQGVIWSLSRLGGALTPLVVIPLQQAFGWRVSFGVLGFLGVIWAVVWHAWFRDNPADQPAVSAAELREIGSQASRVAEPRLPWRQVLRRPNLWWILVMYHAYCWSGFFFLTWMHPFLESARGFRPPDLIRLSWIPFVAAGVANLSGGFASDYLVRRVGLKWGRKLVGLAGLGTSAAALGTLLLVHGKFATIACLALAYGGSDFMMPAAWAVCLDIGGRNAGAVTGAMNTAGQTGSFLSTVFFGYALSATGGFGAALALVAVMTAISALCWFKIDATDPLVGDGRPTEETPDRSERIPDGGLHPLHAPG